MSNQAYYQPPAGPPPGHAQQAQGNHYGSNNPYATAQEAQNAWQQQPSHNPQTQSHAPGSGGFGNAAPPGQAPNRSDTFKESDFVPESQRGEQREALEQFEMNKGPQTQEDRDLETLQREFPGVDGSLIAALYADNGSMGATREVLGELAGQN
jgi:hypothetical protein